MDLQGKVAIVTGASRGIGRQIAVALAKAGVAVVIAARTVDRRRSLPGTIGDALQEIEDAGGRAVAVQADIAKPEDIEGLTAAAIEHFGRLDIVINNAAHTQGNPAPLQDYDLASWTDQYATNVHAPFLMMKSALPLLKQQGGGIIINMTSEAGDLLPFDPAYVDERLNLGSLIGYASTKAALNRLSNALAFELAPANIGVVCLDPGFTKTERVDVLNERGFVDAATAHGMEVPVRSVMRILGADSNLAFSGAIVRANEDAAV